MSTITYIRHGQASFLKADYDNLSDLGWEQTELLGKHFADQNAKIDKIYMGPLKRHRQTYEGILKGMAAQGKQLETEPIILEGLKEHKLPEIMRLVLPHLIENNDEIKEIASIPTATDLERKKVHFRLFETVFLMWAEGKLEGLYEGFQNYPEFRKLAFETLEHIKSNTHKDENVIVVTSGGPVGASVGDTLELSDKKTLEVSWEVFNASITNYKLTKKVFRLLNFNAIPHLTKSSFRTLV